MSEHRAFTAKTSRLNGNQPPPSRREVLAGVAVGAVAFAGSTIEPKAGIGGDNTLIAAEHETMKQHTTMNAPGSGEITDEEWDAHSLLLDHMARIPANTPRGILAKVRAYRTWMSDELANDEFAEDRLLNSLLADVERLFTNN